MNNIIKYENFLGEIEKAAYEVYMSLSEEDLNEGSAAGSVDTKGSKSDKALRKKAKASGFPLGILKEVFKRGKAAWKTGHVGGVGPDQWAHARVNSFIVGGKTTKMHDKALYQQARKAKAAKKKK